MAGYRHRLGIAIGVILVMLPQGCEQDQGQRPGRSSRLDKTQAFYCPKFAAQPQQVLAETSAGPIDAATYLRYLAARHGTRYLEDLAFDILLARECKARRLGGSAPLLARSNAARRFPESGRSQSGDANGDLRRKFANEALRQLRVDALAAADRAADDKALRALFDRVYGVGGQRVRVRQILVSFALTKERLTAVGESTDEAAVRAAARRRARALREELRSGSDFASLLSKSDDRTTRRLLADPARKTQAGFLAGYNYRRYGQGFADTVRSMDVGEVSAPVESTIGLHLVQLVDRKTTKLEDVEAALRKELGRERARPSEALALRRALLAKYRFRSKPGGR
ncbi:MAG: peptidylprolyl isomerase [Planctomycetota bacterium]|jgi:hypothetical protein